MENNEEMAVNQTSAEESAVDTTPVVEKQTTEEVAKETTELAGEGESEAKETGQSKKGANARIHELNSKVKSLTQRLQEITGGNGEIPAQQLPPQIDIDSEISPEQYRQHVLQQADSIVQIRLKQSEALGRIEKESLEVIKAYPQLDPDSDQFDKDLSETISEAIEAQVKLNPYSASVKKFADRLMKPFTKAVSNQVAQEREVITRQASESALRPTNVRKQEKSAGEKSIKELEAELGIVQA